MCGVASPRRDVIMMLHQLFVIISNGMPRYYPERFIGLALVQAVKFCCLGVHQIDVRGRNSLTL